MLKIPIIFSFHRFIAVRDPGVAEWSFPTTKPEAGAPALTAGARDQHLPHPRWLLRGGVLPGQRQSHVCQTEPGKHHTGHSHWYTYQLIILLNICTLFTTDTGGVCGTGQPTESRRLCSLWNPLEIPSAVLQPSCRWQLWPITHVQSAVCNRGCTHHH